MDRFWCGRSSCGHCGPRSARPARDGEPIDEKILPLRIEVVVADKMYEARRAKCIKNRMKFFRQTIGHYLVQLGALASPVLLAIDRYSPA